MTNPNEVPLLTARDARDILNLGPGNTDALRAIADDRVGTYNKATHTVVSKADAERLERVDEAVAEMRAACDVLSTIYAKYGTKIGPYASQAQAANVRLRSAADRLSGKE